MASDAKTHTSHAIFFKVVENTPTRLWFVLGHGVTVIRENTMASSQNPRVSKIFQHSVVLISADTNVTLQIGHLTDGSGKRALWTLDVANSRNPTLEHASMRASAHSLAQKASFSLTRDDA
jgi:hypothetical protein